MEGSDLNKADAIAFAAHLKKLFAEKGQWCKIAEINEPELKFIKIEASIKVKQ